MKAKAAANGWTILEKISNFDDNKQFEQVKAMIGRKVDGILIIQTDSKAVIPAIRAANEAGIPMVHFNRPPAPRATPTRWRSRPTTGRSPPTVQFLVDEAKKSGASTRPCIMIGDLGDVNAIQRRDGFFDVVDKNPDIVEVVARVSTEWNADKAFAGLTNAMQANPDIDFLFTSSDFMLPQIQQVLETFDKWHKIGEEGHVLFGGFDGDANAYQLLADGYMEPAACRTCSSRSTWRSRPSRTCGPARSPRSCCSTPASSITPGEQGPGQARRDVGLHRLEGRQQAVTCGRGGLRLTQSHATSQTDR